MGVALVLLAASALIGATAGLRLKAIALAPIAVLIALVSAAVLRMHGFGPGIGIVVIIGCIVLNQSAYLLVELMSLCVKSSLSLGDAADDQPSGGREQAIDGY